MVAFSVHSLCRCCVRAGCVGASPYLRLTSITVVHRVLVLCRGRVGCLSPHLASPPPTQAAGLSWTRHLRGLLQGRGGHRALPREFFVFNECGGYCASFSTLRWMVVRRPWDGRDALKNERLYRAINPIGVVLPC